MRGQNPHEIICIKLPFDNRVISNDGSSDFTNVVRVTSFIIRLLEKLPDHRCFSQLHRGSVPVGKFQICEDPIGLLTLTAGK